MSLKRAKSQSFGTNDSKKLQFGLKKGSTLGLASSKSKSKGKTIKKLNNFKFR